MQQPGRLKFALQSSGSVVLHIGIERGPFTRRTTLPRPLIDLRGSFLNLVLNYRKIELLSNHRYLQSVCQIVPRFPEISEIEIVHSSIRYFIRLLAQRSS